MINLAAQTLPAAAALRQDDASWPRVVIAGSVAGMLSYFGFHQGTQAVLHLTGWDIPLFAALFGLAPPAYVMDSAWPLGLPALLSEALWGGLLGIMLAALLRRPGVFPTLFFGFLFGTIFVGCLSLTVILQAKGLPIFANGDRATCWRVAFLYGVWGWGTALLLLPVLRRG